MLNNLQYLNNKGIIYQATNPWQPVTTVRLGRCAILFPLYTNHKYPQLHLSFIKGNLITLKGSILKLYFFSLCHIGCVAHFLLLWQVLLFSLPHLPKSNHNGSGNQANFLSEDCNNLMLGNIKEEEKNIKNNELIEREQPYTCVLSPLLISSYLLSL